MNRQPREGVMDDDGRIFLVAPVEPGANGFRVMSFSADGRVLSRTASPMTRAHALERARAAASAQSGESHVIDGGGSDAWGELLVGGHIDFTPFLAPPHGLYLGRQDEGVVPPELPLMVGLGLARDVTRPGDERPVYAIHDPDGASPALFYCGMPGEAGMPALHARSPHTGAYEKVWEGQAVLSALEHGDIRLLASFANDAFRGRSERILLRSPGSGWPADGRGFSAESLHKMYAAFEGKTRGLTVDFDPGFAGFRGEVSLSIGRECVEFLLCEARGDLDDLAGWAAADAAGHGAETDESLVRAAREAIAASAEAALGFCGGDDESPRLASISEPDDGVCESDDFDELMRWIRDSLDRIERTARRNANALLAAGRDAAFRHIQDKHDGPCPR